MRKVLVIDGMNMVYAAYYAYSKLQNSGKPISIIYGFPCIIAGLINKLKPDDIHIVWEGRRSKERLLLHPEYKMGRRSMLPEQKLAFFKQVKTTKLVMDCLGVKQYHDENIEGDDLIFLLTQKLKKDNIISVIVSNDKDFHQLIGDRVRVYSKSKEILLHHKNLHKHFGYRREYAKDYLILRGDDSDNIPNYPGIGEKKALDFFKEFSSIKEYIKSNKVLKHIDKDELAILYKRNRELIDLKYFASKHLSHVIVAPLKENPKIRKKRLIRLCEKYNIKTFLKPEFLNPFYAYNSDSLK